MRRKAVKLGPGSQRGRSAKAGKANTSPDRIVDSSLDRPNPAKASAVASASRWAVEHPVRRAADRFRQLFVVQRTDKVGPRPQHPEFRVREE